MRCVSYTRTTSCKEDGKIPADIIKQQDQHIQEYLKKQGWTLSAKYCDRKKDTEENTAFEELTKDGIDRKFDMVVVDSIDRCSRTISCADDVLVKTFVPAGIHFAVVQDEFISIGKTKEELYEYIKKARYEAVQLKGIKEKKNAVDVRLVMPSVRKRLFLWSRTKKALNIQRLMRINVFIVISVSRYVQSKRKEHSEEES